MKTDSEIDSSPTQTAPVQVAGNYLHYAGYRAIAWLAAVVPYPFQYAIAGIASGLYYRLDNQARRNMLGNMRAVVGVSAREHDVRALGRGAFNSFGRFVCEFIGLRNLSPEFLDGHVNVSGLEHLRAGLAGGRGVLLCSAHYSNWEVGAAKVARMGFPLTVVVQQHANEKVDALFVAAREKAGIRVAYSHNGALRALKALKRNEVVAILGDRPTGGPTVSVELFGRSTDFPQGPWRISMSSGAAIVPVFVQRSGADYALKFGAPLKNFGYNDPRRSAQHLAQQWAHDFEAQVKSDPSQWSVFYPVWPVA